MNRRLFRGIVLMFIVALAMMFVTKAVRAEASVGTGSASAKVFISITVVPVLQVLEKKPVPGGYQIRVYTNMKSSMLDGQYVTFSRVGDQTVFVPTSTTTTTDGLHVVTRSSP